MKKFFFSILAVGALVACTKSEVKFEGETEIAFSPVTSTATKANVYGAIEGTTYPTGETFYVWGYWQDVPAGSNNSAFTDPKTYINGQAFKYASGQLWQGRDKSYYWPKTGSMIFAALSPVDAPVRVYDNYPISATHKLSENKFLFEYDNPYETHKTVDLLWANNTVSYSEATAGTEGVPVKFNHALAWITFRVKGESVTQDGGFKINSLTLNSVQTKAQFNSLGNGSWAGYENAVKNYVVFTDNLNGSQNLTSALVDLENTPKGTLVIPQSKATDYTATLKYTNYLGDTPIVETIELKLGTGWEIGKHYIYNITFTPREILLKPEVAEWVTEETTFPF